MDGHGVPAMTKTSRVSSDEVDVKERIRRSWDRSAEGYDDRFSHGIKSSAEGDAWRLLLRRLLPADRRLRILDIGTGTGFLALLLADQGHDVSGIDVSAGMLEVARRKAQGAGYELDLRVADGQALPFEDGLFDAVVSRHVLWTLIEPERAVREWVRVTRAGGRVIAIDGLWRGDGFTQRGAALLDWAVTAVRERRLPHRRFYSQEMPAQFPLRRVESSDPARNVFIRAGLRNIRTEELTWIDAVERQTMPARRRFTLPYRACRYLVEGDV
jgi:ubiquinone/menaquinone biosynthesis C-methylase UbiE